MRRACDRFGAQGMRSCGPAGREVCLRGAFRAGRSDEDGVHAGWLGENRVRTNPAGEYCAHTKRVGENRAHTKRSCRALAPAVLAPGVQVEMATTKRLVETSRFRRCAADDGCPSLCRLSARKANSYECNYRPCVSYECVFRPRLSYERDSRPMSVERARFSPNVGRASALLARATRMNARLALDSAPAMFASTRARVRSRAGTATMRARAECYMR